MKVKYPSIVVSKCFNNSLLLDYSSMVHGLGNTKLKKKPYKSTIERDILLHKDLREAYLQRGKVMGTITRSLFSKTKRKQK